MIRIKWLYAALVLLATSVVLKSAHAQGIPVVGGGSLSYARPSAPIQCGNITGAVYNFYGYVYFNNGVEYGISTGGTFWHSINCTTLKPDPPVTTTFSVPGYQGGTCTIAFTIFTATETSAVLTCASGVQGYINPKYLILGVTYAPPGGNTYSSVSYQDTAMVGFMSSTSASFQSSYQVDVDASLTVGIDLLGTGGGVTVEGKQSKVLMQTAKTTDSITINRQTSNTFSTPGVPNVYSPVNHDYDIVYLWLNPSVLYTTYSAPYQNVVLWSGYGYDLNDPVNEVDIWPVYVGWLNGDFGPFDAQHDPQDVAAFARSWVKDEAFADGDGPAITAADFGAILSADPFAYNPYDQNSGYQVTVVPGSSPATTTDGRFTVADLTGGATQTIPYRQAPPSSSQGEKDIYQTMYTVMSQVQNSSDFSYSVSYGLDLSLKASAFGNNISGAFNQTWKSTWDYMSMTQQTTTNTQVATATITGPPCPAIMAPCSPEYTEPRAFTVYQDNLYGTFLFQPDPYFSITGVTPSTATVQAGSSTSFVVATQENAGYAGTSVGLTVQGLPAGAVAGAASGVPGSNITLPISVGPGVAAGTYPLTLQAFDGSQSYFTYPTLVVTALPPATVATTTALSVSPSGGTLVAGTAYTITATVTANIGTAVPSGQVVFTIGSSQQTALLDATGSAKLTLTAPTTAQTLSLAATYQGSSPFTASSATANETVTVPPLVSTSLALSSSPSGTALAPGALVTLVAVVSSSGSSATPSGSIVFDIAGTTVSAILNASGTATLTTAAPTTPGLYSVTASYAGNSQFGSSNSNAISLTVLQPNPVLSTTTTLVVAPSGGTVAAGGSFTLTAFVTPGSGSATPTGSVLFTVGSSTFQGKLDATGLATYVGTASCFPGTETFQAVYEGSSGLSSSQSSPVTVSITGTCAFPATTTDLSVNPSGGTLNAGSSYTLSIAVSSSSPACMPSGTVTLSIGATTQTVSLNSAGVGTMAEVAPSAAGSLSISATYGGSAICAGSVSNTLNLTIAPGVASGFTISGTPAAVTVGSKTTDTIIVSSTGGFSGPVTLSASVSGPANAVAPTVSFAGGGNVTVTSGTSGSAVLTITTAAPVMAGTFRSNELTYACFGLPILAGLLFGVRRRNSTQWLCGFLLCMAIASIAGCGAGMIVPQTAQPGTTPGTYTVTVTGTANGVSASGTFTVTVQ